MKMFEVVMSMYVHRGQMEGRGVAVRGQSSTLSGTLRHIVVDFRNCDITR